MRRRLLFAALVVVGCGDNLQGTELDELGEARRAAECERLVRCGLFTQQNVCTTFFRDDGDPDLEAAVGESKLRYDARAARQCVAALSATSCDATDAESRSMPEACRRMFEGLVEDGGDCAFDLECRSGTCDAPGCPRSMCCAGRCNETRIDVDLGGECILDAQCAEGAACAKDGRCRALAVAGGSCDRDVECDVGLACVGATEFQTGTCRPLPAIGEACPYQRCAEIGARCRDGVCAPVGLPGDPCTTATDCSVYAECDAGGICRDYPTLGQSCSTACAGDAWCREGSCVPPRENLEQCGADNECASLFCDVGPLFDYCTDLPVCI